MGEAPRFWKEEISVVFCFLLLEPRLFALGRDLPEHCRLHGRNNVADNLLTFDKMIPRSRLRPQYGSGWQPL
jgi:hypothetical protein